MGKKKTTFNINKEENFSEWYSEILNKAEVTDMRYGVKGFLVIRPWGTMILEKMFKIYESALKRTGHFPAVFPVVIPEGNFHKEAEHVEGFTPQVFWLDEKSTSGEDRLALRPTSETAFYQMYNLWIRSYRDLPLKIYQRANVYRNETKATRPLIRSREFHWIEAHNCFATKKEAEKQVLEDIGMTESVMHQIFGIPFLPLKRPEWDKFAGAEYTVGSDCILPDGKLLQQPSTHLLGQHFSKAFDVKFLDEKEKENYVWQTCYGPCMSRILASVISSHGDDNGLILPYVLSPIQVVIVPILKGEGDEEVLLEADKMREVFFSNNIDSKIDDSEKRPGEKFFFWEMKGVPFRIELGKKEIESGELTVFIRDTKEKVKIKVENLIEDIRNLGAEFDARLKAKADSFFDNRVVECLDKKEIKKVLDSGKIAKFGFCSVGLDGVSCAEVVEKEFGAEIRGTLADKKEKPKGKCPFCGKDSKEFVYAGRSY